MRVIYFVCEKIFFFYQTYNVDKATPDSAGTATAYLCGVKANTGTLGVTDAVKLSDCSALNETTKVRSILKDSIKTGANDHTSYVGAA
jgi:alkaline phosphatase